MTSIKSFDIRIYAGLISIVLSLIAYHSYTPINYDGILYLATATAYSKSGLSAAMALYPWPFYSILIASISKLTWLSTFHAAELLNTALFVVIITTFLTLLKELGATRAIQIAGAIIILIYPALNDFRSIIVRDFGYWAFSLIALWQLMRYAQHNTMRSSWGWSLAIFIATLFRIEGIIVLLLAPLALLLLRDTLWPHKITLLLKCYIPTALLIVIYLLWHISHGTTHPQLGRIPEILYQVKNAWTLISANFAAKSNIAASQILTPYSVNYTHTFLFVGFSAIFLSQLIVNLTPLYTVFCGDAMAKNLMHAPYNYKIILVSFTVINLIIPLIFFSQAFFLSSRYLMPFCLPVLLWAPYSLQWIYTYRRRRDPIKPWRPWLLPLIALALILMGVSGFLHFNYSKTYIIDAGLWLKTNTPHNASVYSNNKQILYYAERTPINWQINWTDQYDDSNPLQTTKNPAWLKYDYLALRITHESANDEAAILKIIGKPPVQQFSNKRHDMILIFKVK